MRSIRFHRVGPGPGRRALAIVAFLGALGAGSSQGVVHAADQRLADALLALEKGQLLLLAAEPGVVPRKAERQFERHIERAVRLIELAMEHVGAAQDAVDAP